jgi:hypothetical protein
VLKLTRVYKVNDDYINWFLSQDVDVFATITLTQGIQRDFALELLRVESAENTAWKLRDRIMKRVVGPAAYRAKVRLPFIVMCEGDGILKRRHLHILTKKPEHMPFEEYEDEFLQSLHKLEWVRKENKVEPIDSVHATIRYVLKEGSDAFLPGASYLH